MTKVAEQSEHGVLSEDATLTITRLLPGPIEKVWAYLSDSDLRRQWLAAGDMAPRAGSRFELVWRNDELGGPSPNRPEEWGGEHRLSSEITEWNPPRRLAFTWGNTGGVSFELEPVGAQVLLTVIHRRIEDRASQLNISTGWHAHLDILAAKLSGETPPPFWDVWASLRADYEQLLAS